MADRVRDIILQAITAARYGVPPPPALSQALSEGNRELTLDNLQFDSLGWTEFCIAIELQSGQELTPLIAESMHYMFEVEDWLRQRMFGKSSAEGVHEKLSPLRAIGIVNLIFPNWLLIATLRMSSIT